MMLASFGSTAIPVIGPATLAGSATGAAVMFSAALVTGAGPVENHCVGVAFAEPPRIASETEIVAPVGVMTAFAVPVTAPRTNVATPETPASVPPNVTRYTEPDVSTVAVPY